MRKHNEYDCNPFRMCFISLKRIETSTSAWQIGNISHFSVPAAQASKIREGCSKSLSLSLPSVLLQNRGRLAEKRTIPLPPTRVPKKELASVFSSDDSEGSERASGDHADIKQEELHYTIMRKRWEFVECVLCICVSVWVGKKLSANPSAWDWYINHDLPESG